jgi:capsular polysaccharide biosynthesis protein
MSRPHNGPDRKAVGYSGRLFQRLLAAYPKEHRRQYGPAMSQLFRDQCRDAWASARAWGLTGLWVRVLPDLIKTSVLEHLSTLKERKTMLERLGTLLRPRFEPLFVFVAVFVPVFLLVVAASTLITFIMPESYSSTVRMLPGWTVGDRAGQLEFESIQSDTVLGKVIHDLDLNQAWGKKYAGGSPLKTAETLALLKGRIDLRTVRGTDLIEIRTFSDNPSEAAMLANAIAVTYREARSSAFSVDIVDKAVPGLRPVRPNKPLNIALGILGGMVLALAAGAGMAGFAAWIGRRSRGTGASPGTGAVAPPDLPHADGRPAKSALDKLTGILWMAIGGALFGLTLVALVWFLIFQQTRVTAELLFLPVFGLVWGCNTVLGFFLLRGKRWARICLGVEGVLCLTYYFFRDGFPLPYCPAWVSIVIFRLGSFAFGPVPYISRWVFIALALASIGALFWPRKETAAHPC